MGVGVDHFAEKIICMILFNFQKLTNHNSNSSLFIAKNKNADLFSKISHKNL